MPDEVDDILDFAIDREQEAHEFYTRLAGQATRPGMRQTFADFAQEELNHKHKLKAIKAGGKLLRSRERVQDLGIAHHTVDVEPGRELGYQEALILAMKREQASQRLYTDLAAATEDAELREAFLALAQEEAKHKLRFETEYDEVVLQEN
ncbi:MAG: ferritin family protein [Polyangiaceae bacterium]|nr:ferritin family protein [Polyangiaceae bacterium]